MNQRLELTLFYVRRFGEISTVTKQGKTLLISTHVMDEVKYCDYGILIRDGKVIAADSSGNTT